VIKFEGGFRKMTAFFTLSQKSLFLSSEKLTSKLQNQNFIELLLFKLY